MLRSVSLFAAAALVLSAGLATAGTKFQGTIVPLAPTGNPTLANSSSFQLKGVGAMQVKLKKVTDSTGAPVTTGTTPDVEYYAVISGVVFTSNLGPISFQLDEPMPLKKGSGAIKPSLTNLTALASQGTALQITGVDVYTPPAAGDVAACEAVLTGAVPGVVLPPASNPCATGTRIGVGGIQDGI
ncbi:MAG TPA: hypothetical protein VKW76_11105 [Candidatus Binatia bacterium]|nr:hypothetical protein [Candidatus Binatia bacterium]